ncbi:uncharacterized protein LOC134242415 [Saccostrea cucullata]|uniref:uncharacterized protein LOC134242415 n=1 Tax=Saccostrea cuccullata TaxID=36930 RepID=UPI002ED602B0
MQNAEWNYTEIDIKVHKNDIIFFESIRGDNGAHVAVDDITLIKGKCRDTFSSLLFMKGEVKCNFEGNKDICFDQDNGDNFDWIIARNGQRITNQKTGPNSSIEGNYYSYIDTSDSRRQKNFKAVLISKFKLTDVNITFSMQYHMYGKHINTLRVYLKNGTMELEIFRKTGNQGKEWNRFTNTTKIKGTWKLLISANKGNGNLGYIAIDDIQIKINRRDLKYNWMNQNERCKDNLGVYAINHRQLPNQSCLSFDFDRWTGIIRPQRRGTATKGLAKHPTKVQVYRSLGLNYKYIWEAFNSTLTRPFVCEKNLREEKESVYISATSFGDTIVGVLVACASIIILCIIVFVIYKKRKKATKFKKQNDISPITKKNATYLNDSETKHSTEKKLIEVNKQKTHQRKELNDYDKINHDAAKRKYDLSLENDKFRKECEEDYDHLHQTSNSMTSKPDDLYSHMTGSQYESQRIITDDTYAHTVEIENEYGARQLTHHNDNETYDHALALDIDPSGEYNKLHQDN